MKHQTLAHFRHFSHFRHSTIITYFQTHSILTNKPNFRNDKMNINLDMTSNYKILSAGSGQKTKPIQTQLKPIQTQFKPNLTQNKPNSKPIKPKTNPIQTQLKPKQSQFKPNLSQNKANSNPIINYRQSLKLQALLGKEIVCYYCFFS